MLNYKINENIIKTDKFEITFEYEIDTVLPVDDMFIVLLKIPKGSKEVDNLYGITSTGDIKWRVQSVQEAFNIPQNTPYIALDIVDNDKIRVTNFYGMRYSVNPKNGFLIEKECIGW